MMMKQVVLLCLLFPVVFSLIFSEDDLVFDDVGEEGSNEPIVEVDQKEQRTLENKKKFLKVERYQGIPNVSAIINHAFYYEIPPQAFHGTVDHFKVRSKNDKSLPKWLLFDKKRSTFIGVPTRKDLGVVHVTVKAFGNQGASSNDNFTIKVLTERSNKAKHKDKKKHCDENENPLLMVLLLDVKFEDIKPKMKVEALRNLAGYLGLNLNEISMHGRSGKEEKTEEYKIINSGPGNVKRRGEKHSTRIEWQIGCDGQLWRNVNNLTNRIRSEARDGTLSEVLQLPVYLWQKCEVDDLSRIRREAGSGDYANPDDNDEDYEENYDEEYDENYDEDENGGITEIPPGKSSNEGKSFDSTKNFIDENESEHPHRHHHGEETIGWKTEENVDEHDIIPAVHKNDNESTTLIPRLTSAMQTSTATSTPSTTTTTTSSTSTSTTITSMETQSPETSAATVMTTNQQVTAVPTNPGDVDTSPPPTISTSVTTIMNNNSIVQTTVEDFTKVPSDFETTLSSENITQPAISTTTTATSSTNISSSTPPGSTTVPDQVQVISAVNNTIEHDDEMFQTTLETSAVSTSAPTVAMATTLIVDTSMVPSTTPQVELSTTTPSPSPPPTTTTTTSTTTTTVSTTMPTTTSSSTITPITTASTSTLMTTPEVRKISTVRTDYKLRNYPPKQDRTLQKISITAGKPLSYLIPDDIFSDIEDGNTRNLRLTLTHRNETLPTNHWLQFNPQTQEIYGLPLEDDIFIWHYELTAFDKEGLSVSDNIDVYVQQHKSSKSMNHEFSIYLNIYEKFKFPSNVDWELKVLRGLAEVYGDKDDSEITVRNVVANKENESQVIFSWTNDSIPRGNDCPKDEIYKLFHVLIANKKGDPSAVLSEALAPEIRVMLAAVAGLNQCVKMNEPEVVNVPTQETKINFPPSPRNQVDHINATEGQLIVYRVPEDSFYDSEDGSAREMKMTLYTNNRSAIPPDNWLQFDAKNQEFYGVPMKKDIRRQEYQLSVADREGATATDGLVVVVSPAPDIEPSAEFTITLGIDYDSFVNSAMQKRNFIQKLKELFGDKDTKAITLTNITTTGKNTIVTWRNTTLPTTYCPHKEITKLSEVLFVKPDNKELTNRIEKTMGPELPVDQLTLTPMGICQGEFTRVHSHDNFPITPDDSTSVNSSHDDYLITFVLPAIIIAAMLILAGIIACVLYRRKRSGKMSVSEHDDERQTFRSKGIPVIFQDELDEKPDPGNKAPVILKEEKPPLPPPEYNQRAEDGADQPMLPKEHSEEPYQPPPPFARTSDNSRQNRPKPTPTYRKPPPYVPP